MDEKKKTNSVSCLQKNARNNGQCRLSDKGLNVRNENIQRSPYLLSFP